MQTDPSSPEHHEIEVLITDPRLYDWGLPRYQTQGAAAIDLYASLETPLVLLPQAKAELVSTGMRVLIGNPAVVGLLAPRSGAGHKLGLVLGNLQGVIDSDYSGTLYVSAWNRSPPGTEPLTIQPGDRIAQMLFMPVLRPEFRFVNTFSQATERGAGGFGSTGGIG